MEDLYPGVPAPMIPQGHYDTIFGLKECCFYFFLLAKGPAFCRSGRLGTGCRGCQKTTQTFFWEIKASPLFIPLSVVPFVLLFCPDVSLLCLSWWLPSNYFLMPSFHFVPSTFFLVSSFILFIFSFCSLYNPVESFKQYESHSEVPFCFF